MSDAERLFYLRNQFSGGIITTRTATGDCEFNFQGKFVWGSKKDIQCSFQEHHIRNTINFKFPETFFANLVTVLDYFKTPPLIVNRTFHKDHSRTHLFDIKSIELYKLFELNPISPHDLVTEISQVGT